MTDSENIAAMRRQAQRLQDDGAFQAAQAMRDGADRLEQLTQNAAAPYGDLGPQDEAYVGLPDGTRVPVVQFGDLPRLKRSYDATRGPIPDTDYEA